MPRIFDGYAHVQMAMATAHLSTLHYRAQGELTNLLINIKSIDDPYYMYLTGSTYGKLAKMGKERAIAA